MTRKRDDNHSTEFGLWLRDDNQYEIGSGIGFLATNIDFLWHNWTTGEVMLVEEKRYSASMPLWQYQTFVGLASACRIGYGDYFRGFCFLQFEKTSPDDGVVRISRIPEDTDVMHEAITVEERQNAYGGPTRKIVHFNEVHIIDRDQLIRLLRFDASLDDIICECCA